MRTSITLTLLVWTWTLTDFAQTLNLRPGKYETTSEWHMPGMKMPPMKSTDCITPEDLKDVSKAFGDEEFAKSCKVSDYKVTGNKVTFNTDCKDDGVRMTGTTEMTFTPESFTGLGTTKDDKGNVFTIKTSGKRIGECTK